MDGDYKDSLKHLCELQWELQQQKVEAALEQSRRGAHLEMPGVPLKGSDSLVTHFTTPSSVWQLPT